MKISSRSILSPARAGAARDPPPLSLSNSHSRRLRNSRSIKGGASPAMFPATGKKRGSGFENPEPSSPKVTCIGQVRVKSKKKHAKNLRSLSRRRSAGEVSFRRLEHSGNGFGSQSQNLGSNQECLPLQRNNQRWVHLPLTICEGLRAFGSEVSCLFPCRSSCSSTTAMEKEEKMVGENRQGSCGAGFARWLVALQEGDGGGRDTGGGGGGEREVELVAGYDDDENEEIDEIGIKNSRRHVFQDLEIVNDSVLGTIDEARVSTCVPPKNALLLMRCRSDPMKMEALTNRFWEPNMEKNEEEEEDEDEESFKNEEKIEESVIPENLQPEEEETHMGLIEVSNQEHDDLQEKAIDQEKTEKKLELEMEKKVQEEEVETNPEMETKQSIEEEEEEEEEDNQEQSIETNEEEEESMYLWSLFEENTDQNQEPEETEEEEEEEEEEEVHSEMEDAQEQLSEDEDIEETEACESNSEFEEENEEINNKSKSLPECLLLMMYEPKLSMEVSRETWVCSTDFIRRHSGRKPPPVPPPIKSIAGEDESKCQPVLQQPARYSCSSMATKFDQKLVNTNGFEPLILTRCKSEPMKLAPESCFWKNKLEPPRRASFGIDVAGFGF